MSTESLLKELITKVSSLDHKFNTLVSELSRLSTENVSTDDLLRIKQIARATARGDKTALKQWNKEHRA